MINFIRAICKRIGKLFSVFPRFRPSSGKPVVLLWAPECDALTRETAKWANLLAPSGFRVYRLIGNVLRHQVQKCLEVVYGKPAIACFLGHGLSYALLGHPYGTKDGRPAASSIYDVELVDLGPRYLFAYCCSAGQELGQSFGIRRPGSFLGFINEIGIDAKNDLCRQTWVDILRHTFGKMVGDRAITLEHRNLLDRLYEEAFWFYQTGEGHDNEENVLMKMYLVGQQEALIYR